MVFPCMMPSLQKYGRILMRLLIQNSFRQNWNVFQWKFSFSLKASLTFYRPEVDFDQNRAKFSVYHQNYTFHKNQIGSQNREFLCDWVSSHQFCWIGFWTRQARRRTHNSRHSKMQHKPLVRRYSRQIENSRHDKYLGKNSSSIWWFYFNSPSAVTTRPSLEFVSTPVMTKTAW